MGSCCFKLIEKSAKSEIKLDSSKIESIILKYKNPDFFIKRYKKLPKSLARNELYSVYLVKCMSTETIRVAKDYKY